jgi:hypothetical protein
MFEPLDPRQVTRIESVHRGFLYQHLYAVGCLLLAGENAIRVVTIERDEDIELEDSRGNRVYVQVKTRSSPLIQSDIAEVLERFEAIRSEHHSGRRPGSGSFVIISNAVPGPELRALLRKGPLSAGVILLWPGAPAAGMGCLPPAWPDVPGAVAWCVDRSQALPMRMIEPGTLVWKLAGRVQFAAMGGTTGHSFSVQDLPTLFEQLATQLQKFPTPPMPYRPQDGEPPLDRPERVRIVVGLSGAGKTAWAAQAAMHTTDESCAYYDVGDVPGPAIAASLVRELTAQWASHDVGSLRQVLLPGATGIEALRALDAYLASNGRNALVVLDNAHRVAASDLRVLIDATRHLRFVLLAQPSASAIEVGTLLSVEPETLPGWSLDEIAAEAKAQGARGSVTDLDRLRQLTGGLPLYVRTAAQLSATQYAGNLGAMCGAIEAHTHVTPTAQEIILTRLFDALPRTARDSAAVLSLSDVPLIDSEAAHLIQQTLGIEPRGFAETLRQLQVLGVIRLFGGQRLQLHDAFRVLGLRHFSSFPVQQANSCRKTLKELIVESFVRRRDASRFPLYIRTLVELGELKTLIDLATEEWFHELGISAGIWEALDAASGNESIDAEQRFYALDGLVFAEMKAGSLEKVSERLQHMERLLTLHHLGAHERLAFQLKKVVLNAIQGREDLVMEGLEKAKTLLPDKPAYKRIFRYNTAMALFKVKRFAAAEQIARELIEEYYDVLGLAPSDVIMRSNLQIAGKLPKTDSVTDDLKHLADSLDILAKAVNAQGRDSGLARIHAAKFYGLANAIDSFINVNQDLVDEFVGRADFIGARQVMEEHLLPAVVAHKMVDKIVGVRSQYAVVLGYCGEYDAAEDELARLDAYRPGLSAAQAAELDAQRALVSNLRRLGVRSDMLIQTPEYLRQPRNSKVGRNAACPCGSGRKYKHCHGA